MHLVCSSCLLHTLLPVMCLFLLHLHCDLLEEEHDCKVIIKKGKGIKIIWGFTFILGDSFNLDYSGKEHRLVVGQPES